MPDAYTHIRVARAARLHSGIHVPRTAAYEMGANGPDPMIAYRAYDRAAPCPLLMLARRVHTEQCGRFLRTMIFSAATPAQRSYTLGFLTHYAADSTIHPYVAFQTGEKGQYHRPFGHAWCESAMDSMFCEMDTGSRAVPPDTVAPALAPDEIAEVTALLRDAIGEVYGEQVTQESLADAFHEFAVLHRLAYSPHGGKRMAVGAAAKIIDIAGYAAAHMTPAPPPEGGFAEAWENPYTHQPCTGGPEQLFVQSAQLAEEYIKAVTAYWEGRSIKHTVAMTVGDRSYMTGLISRQTPPKKGPDA